MVELTPIEIQRRVAARLGLLSRDMLHHRNRSLAAHGPRDLAIYAMRALLGMSYPALGRAFGMHHTSAMDAVRRASARPEAHALVKEIA